MSDTQNLLQWIQTALSNLQESYQIAPYKLDGKLVFPKLHVIYGIPTFRQLLLQTVRASSDYGERDRRDRDRERERERERERSERDV